MKWRHNVAVTVIYNRSAESRATVPECTGSHPYCEPRNILEFGNDEILWPSDELTSCKFRFYNFRVQNFIDLHCQPF